MNPLLYLRRDVFRVTQAEMARIAGVVQSTVSRWENDGHQPSLRALRRIRAAAIARKLGWDDRWLFETRGRAA